ncbi:hypothetical protein [uncultured Gelidibacter sp.]|uniref:hypothetical protein n=1 Tax=uncultured Gelidibacter sp. TaxID=259318 RepID=UPI00262A80E6|nr:hypothetical protein [uncultured Gelidibacter sp.]
MKKIILIALIAVLAITCFESTKNNSSDTQNSEYENSNNNNYGDPPMFVLTEMNGRELEEKAYFTVKSDNTLELKTGDGAIFRYTPTQHFGDDPLCNILATDDRGRNTAICIKPQSGMDVIIMLENDEMKSNFKGYKR